MLLLYQHTQSALWLNFSVMGTISLYKGIEGSHDSAHMETMHQ